jgi:spoIIIJ-associated protein
MRVVEKEGRTKEEAIRLALGELNAKQEDVKIEVLDGGKTGFLGLGPSKPARVRVYLVQEGGGAPAADMAEAAEFLKDVCAKMGLAVKVSVQEEAEDQAVLMLESADSAILIGKHGKTLESLQYLINIIFSAKKESQKKILLDIEGYREKRRASLEKLARNIAEKVRRTRKPYVLEEMNPYERRIIHMTLERERDVETFSLGRGDSNMKKIRIGLKGARQDRRGPAERGPEKKDGDGSQPQ